MSSLKPPLDQPGARQEQHHPADSGAERNDAKSQNASLGRAHSSKRKPSPQPEVSHKHAHLNEDVSETASPRLSGRSESKNASSTTQKGLTSPSPARKIAKPAMLVHAELSEQTFVKLMDSKSDALAHQALCKSLISLTDKAQGFKALALSTPEGQVVGLTHSANDVSKADPPQHSALGLLMYAHLRTVNRPWSENCQLAVKQKPSAEGYRLSGSRLLRRKQNFYLAPSESYGLPEADDPAFDALAQMHASFLKALGITIIKPFELAPETRPVSIDDSSSDSQSSTDSVPEASGRSKTALMCTRINILLQEA